MNIVHICLNGPYTDNWGYQENIIPRYHKKMGHNVTVIALNKKHSDNNGDIVLTDTGDYILEDKVRVIRVAETRNPLRPLSRYFPSADIYHLLYDLKPDIIIHHGLLANIATFQAIKYIKRNKNCKLAADTHENILNVTIKNTIKNKIYIVIRRFLNKRFEKYYEKLFYIVPLCRDFARDILRLDEQKMEFLPLGVDSSLINFEQRDEIKSKTRNKYNISNDSILIVHGGKLDDKKNTKELVEAFVELNRKDTNLIIFGSFKELKYETAVKNIIERAENISYIGMLSQREYHNLFAAADIGLFPSSQSAIWQQALSSGLACIFKYDKGSEYLDLGGNVEFVYDGNKEEILNALKDVLKDNRYKKMQKVALEKGLEFFSYEKISQKMLDI